MAIDFDNCEAYFKGEIRPILFEVYTESGIPFELIDNSREPDMSKAWCTLKDEQGVKIKNLPATLVSDEPSKKRLLCSWDTSECIIGYYRLQIWVLVNISGHTDENGNKITEGLMASEELLRYVKE